jgi:hypothetical protein
MIDNVLPPKRPSRKVTDRPTSFRPSTQVSIAPEQGATKSILNVNIPNLSKEDKLPLHEIDIDKEETATPMAKKKRFNWRKWSKRRKIIVIVLSLILLCGVGGDIYWILCHDNGGPSLSIIKHKKKAVTTIASPLTGVQVSPDLAKRPVTGIMIENSTFARPQSGIQDAGIVYEAIAEGGITRFLTLYQDAQPQYIGPVRSLRPYYLDFSVPFDAGIAHVGGSPDALAQVRNGLKDLDQFFNAGSYWRQSTRDAPHNVYTSFAKLDALNISKGYTSSKFTSFPRKKDTKLTTPTAKSVNFAISGPTYNVHYDYDATSNSYLRSEGGAAHMATISAADTVGKQLHPKVIAALIMGYGIDADGQHSDYTTTGNGNVYIFQDGGVTQGTWSKANRTSQFVFTDASNKPVKLDAGQTWFTVLGASNMVSYTP